VLSVAQGRLCTGYQDLTRKTVPHVFKESSEQSGLVFPAIDRRAKEPMFHEKRWRTGRIEMSTDWWSLSAATRAALSVTVGA
jgi:hypothetical protein